MLSSKNEARQEARFAARLDVLTERVDTLASTVATTASAIAKKDGEIATLRRELELRDQQLQALATRAAQTETPSDPQELNALRQAVAALQAERATKGNSKQLDEVMAKLNLVAQRVDTLSATVSTTAAGLAGRDGEVAAIRKYLESNHAAAQAAPAANPDLERTVRELGGDAVGTKARLDAVVNEIAALKTQLAEPQPHAEEIRAMLTTLRTRVEALDSLRAGVTEDALEQRLAEPQAAVAHLGQRLDELTSDVRSAAAVLAAGNERLEALDQRLAEPQAAVAALGQRLDELTSDVRSAAADLAAGSERLEALQRQVADSSPGAEEIAAVRGQLSEAETTIEALAQRLDKLGARVDSGKASLAENDERLEALERQHSESAERIDSVADELLAARTEVSQDRLDARLDERLATTTAALEVLATRVDELGSDVASATTSHADEEERLETLHRQVTDSGSRIESIADDLREALGAFPEATPDQLAEVGARLDGLEERVASVASEVARAKTLWPVALRSLEARLDDVAPKHVAADEAPAAVAPPTDDSAPDEETEGHADDLLAGLRDSLQAMESVAAELERTAEPFPTDHAVEIEDAPQAVAGGARVVPLRTTDP